MIKDNVVLAILNCPNAAFLVNGHAAAISEKLVQYGAVILC